MTGHTVTQTIACDLVSRSAPSRTTTSDPSGVAELKRGLMINCTEPIHDEQDDS